MAPLTTGAAIRQSGKSAIRRKRPFQWLGARPYSVYMVYALVIALYQKAIAVMQNLSGQPMFVEHATEGVEDRLISFGATWMMDLLALANLGTVVAVANLTYRFVEMPGQSSFNALLLRRRKPAVRQAAVEVTCPLLTLLHGKTAPAGKA